MASRHRKRRNDTTGRLRAALAFAAAGRDVTGGVVSIGECMVEFFDRGDGLWRRGFAGDTLNVAWALRALLPPAIPVAYLSRVGTDAVSQAMLDFIAGAGIATDAISRDPDRTVGLYTIATDHAGERTFSYWRDTSAARRLAADAHHLAASLHGARLVYLSGITAAVVGAEGRAALIAVLTRAKAAGALVAYDPNYRPRLWDSVPAMRSFAEAIAGLADILLPTFDDEAAAFGDGSPEATVARLGGWGCGEVVVKNGANPTVLATGETITTHPPGAGVTPVDTTGAGNSFNGGYLAARLTGQDPARAVQVAQAVAARVIRERGALVAPDLLRGAAGF